MAAETLLSSLLRLLLLGLLLPANLTGGVGSLNLEELSEMRYGIEILPLPVMGGQVRRHRGDEGPGQKERRERVENGQLWSLRRKAEGNRAEWVGSLR